MNFTPFFAAVGNKKKGVAEVRVFVYFIYRERMES